MTRSFLYLLFCSQFTILAAEYPTSNKALTPYQENKGQFVNQHMKDAPATLYLYSSQQLNLQLRNTGFSYDLWQRPQIRENGNTKFHRIDFEFVNVDPDVSIKASGRSLDYQNYYVGKNAVVDVHSYETVIYSNVWPGIDVAFASTENRPKYNFIVHPGADVSDIRLKISGADAIQPDNGGLMIQTAINTVKETLPYSYYEVAGERIAVEAGFLPLGNNEYGISVKGSMLKHVTLVIDPVPEPVWASFYGGNGDDHINDIFTDNSGNVYMAGMTNSTNNIATTGAFQGTVNGSYPETDGYIVKFNATGNRQWATYYGGASADGINSIGLTQNGNYVYATGYTRSPDLYTSTGAHQTTHGGNVTDAFLCKLDNAGAMQWSTYYGGSGYDEAASIAVDAAGKAYISGGTESNTGISTPASHMPVSNGSVSFLAKFDEAGRQAWGTYHGGPSTPGSVMRIAGISKDSIVLFGVSSATTGIGTPGTHQPTSPGGDKIYVVKFDTAGAKHLGTYFGSIGGYETFGGACDAAGNIYVGGNVATNGLATTGAHQVANAGVLDGFLTKFSSSGSLLWSTYYGGSQLDRIRDIAVDKKGDVLVAGVSPSANNIATPGSFIDTKLPAKTMSFIAKFNQNGQRKWGTYIDLYADQLPVCISTDTSDAVYFAGTSNGVMSLPINVPVPHQTMHGGGSQEGFFIKFKTCPSGFGIASSNSPVMKGDTIKLSVTNADSYSWSHPSGFTSNLKDPFIPNSKYSDSGYYSVIVTHQLSGCIDTVGVKVIIIPNVSVGEKDLAGLFSLYPNPATQSFVFKVNSGKPLNIQLVNMQGKIVSRHEQIVQSVTVPVTNLPAGMYLYTVSDGKIAIAQGKLIIQ